MGSFSLRKQKCVFELTPRALRLQDSAEQPGRIPADRGGEPLHSAPLNRFATEVRPATSTCDFSAVFRTIRPTGVRHHGQDAKTGYLRRHALRVLRYRCARRSAPAAPRPRHEHAVASGRRSREACTQLGVDRATKLRARDGRNRCGIGNFVALLRTLVGGADGSHLGWTGRIHRHDRLRRAFARQDLSRTTQGAIQSKLRSVIVVYALEVGVIRLGPRPKRCDHFKCSADYDLDSA